MAAVEQESAGAAKPPLRVTTRPASADRSAWRRHRSSLPMASLPGILETMLTASGLFDVTVEAVPIPLHLGPWELLVGSGTK
jgi:hypothetical protein